MTLRFVSLTAVIGACLAFLGTAAAGSRPVLIAGMQQSGYAPADTPRMQVVSAHPSLDSSVVSPTPGTTVVPGRVLVRFRPGVALTARSDAVSDVNASVETAYSLVPRLELLRLPAGTSVASAVAALSRDPRVQYAVPDLAVKVAATTPNDPLESSQWALSAIGAPQAWDRTTGSAGVTVAVLDTGVQLNHPDLAANIVPGWNFLNNTNDPSDTDGHGTAVSGIIGAVGDNGIGVAGINWHVSLMPLEICGHFCDTSAEVSAIQYAVAHGAKIINASFGGGCPGCVGYTPERDAIAAAGQAGVLYVAGAGNASVDNDLIPFYPASWQLDNVISVAATNESGDLASFSDYGDSVLMAAPGQDIETTALNGTFGGFSGTSAATPQVSGAAALLWAEHPDWTMQQVRMRLLTTVSPLVSLGGPVADCGQLNVDAATDPTVSDRGIVCVHLAGTGSGTVASDPAAISCGSTCGESVAAGTQVTLTATPAQGSTFLGWGGACSGLGECTVDALGVTQVRAWFRASGSPPGWQQHRLASPDGRDSFPYGTDPNYSFYNVAVSGDGSERAKTIFEHGISCSFGDDNGGVFLERHTSAGWVDDGEVPPPAMVDGVNGNWTHCGNWGNVTQLSADGSTLLVAPTMSPAVDDSGNLRYRCAAFVYQRGGSGSWNLDTVLLPPGVDANGTSTPEAGCRYFGIEGAMSADGSRVAMLTDGPDGSGQTVFTVDVYSKSGGTWGLEQQIAVPSPTQYCGYLLGERLLSLSGDGTTLFVGSTECADAGLQHAGLVYAYTRSGTQWTLAQTIHSPAPGAEERFGNETALSQDGNTAVITSDVPGYSWIFEHGSGGWHASAQLNQPSMLFCPLVLQDGARVVCSGLFDKVSFNASQGAIYIYDRPAGGWASQTPQAQEMFATDGLPGDDLGDSNPDIWPTLAAPEDGSFIDAPIALRNLASGALPHDRIGYEFTSSSVDKTLTVSAAGGGAGSVQSDIAGIDCGATCWHDYADGTSVTLTATPDATNGSTFAGWTGDCSGTGTCTLTMSADHSVTANFTPGPLLTVTRSGTGSGKVTSSPAGIDCPSTCSVHYASGTTVQLTATPGTVSTFDGWSGACSGTGSCSVSMTQARNVTATFTAHPPMKLTVSKLGSGTVIGSPSGINCGTTCSHAYAYGSPISLHAVPASGFLFAGWSGDCAGAAPVCNLTMTTPHVVTAMFGKPKVLSFVKAGTGSGVVKSNPAGISCSASCKHSFGQGAVVSLTATAKSGSTFTGWSGACTGTGKCVVTMSAAKTVKATFAHHAAVRLAVREAWRSVVSLLTSTVLGDARSFSH